jgi:hypothetical protein
MGIAIMSKFAVLVRQKNVLQSVQCFVCCLLQGQLVMKMGNLELAAFCVQHAADLNAGLGSSPTQQAIVQAFLKNYDKV